VKRLLVPTILETPRHAPRSPQVPRLPYPLHVVSRDTTPGARKAQLAAYRRLGSARRAEMAYELSQQAQAVTIAGIRSRDRRLSAEAARAVLIRRLLGAELFDAAYPDSA